MLQHFGLELSQPVRSDENPRECELTQQLCDSVQRAGYDGILYRSTRHSGGRNLVAFDPSTLSIERSWLAD